MIARYLLALLLFPLCSALLHAQSDTIRPRRHHASTSTGIIAGYHGFGYHFIELGVARATEPHDGLGGVGYGITGMMRLGGERRIIGGSLSVWSNGLVGLGFNLDYFTDTRDGSSLRLRPEFGVRTGYGRLVYGYSIPLTSGGFDGVNRHDFSLRLFLPWF